VVHIRTEVSARNGLPVPVSKVPDADAAGPATDHPR